MRGARAWLAAALLAAGGPGLAAEPVVYVMVLGTYHFANPGLDLHNAQVDDVRSPRRQAELASVVAGLARFKPTVVAVEAPADALPGRALPAFEAVRDGVRDPGRGETEQIGFRLARAAGLRQVLGVDAPGEFPFEAVQAYAAQAGRAAEWQASLDAVGRRTRAFEAATRKATVADLLRRLNRPAALREDHAWYLQALSFGSGARQPGADLTGRWAARNLGICARLLQSVAPGDRVVLVIGSGHAPLLRQCVHGLPGWRLVEPARYLPGRRR